jgi:dUTP pyrophosphatase
MENINITQGPIISFQKVNDYAKLPSRNNNLHLVGDTGYDIYSVEDIVVPANSTCKVDVGLKIGFISPGYWIRVESRSGLYFKHSITAFPGVIDNGYRGNLGISLINNSEDTPYEVKRGDRIAQLVVYNTIEPVISWTSHIEETSRGENGFGSSGA